MAEFALRRRIYWLRVSFEVLTSEIVLSEIKNKLLSKFNFTEEEIAYAFTAYIDYKIIKGFKIPPDFKSPDPDDTEILAAGLAGEAEYFITGDKALLELKQVGEMRVISPREFLVKYYSAA